MVIIVVVVVVVSWCLRAILSKGIYRSGRFPSGRLFRASVREDAGFEELVEDENEELEEELEEKLELPH